MVLFFPEWEWVGWGKEFEEGGRAGRGGGPETPPPPLPLGDLRRFERSVANQKVVGWWWLVGVNKDLTWSTKSSESPNFPLWPSDREMDAPDSPEVSDMRNHRQF